MAVDAADAAPVQTKVVVAEKIKLNYLLMKIYVFLFR